MALQLFYHPFSSYSQKALIALYENATPFEPQVVGGPDSTVAPRLAQLWPMKQFPLLTDGERTVFETRRTRSASATRTCWRIDGGCWRDRRSRGRLMRRGRFGASYRSRWRFAIEAKWFCRLFFLTGRACAKSVASAQVPIAIQAVARAIMRLNEKFAHALAVGA